jgi:hypothetical protein
VTAIQHQPVAGHQMLSTSSSPELRDVYQELSNVALHQGADLLALLLGAFVAAPHPPCERAGGLRVTTMHADMVLLRPSAALRLEPSCASHGDRQQVRHRPHRQSGPALNHYNTGGHIVASAEASLQKLGTDHLDLLLIHRPDP